MDSPVAFTLEPDDPTEIGEFSLESRLGVGGMGVVYLATGSDGQQVALKVVRPELAQQRGFRVRFAREVTAMQRVSSPMVAHVLAAETEAEQQWMAMEFVTGPTLASFVEEKGPMPQEPLRTLGLGLLEALDSVHNAGLIHRDLKPSNVILGPDGPKVLDFGIAYVMDATSLTATGQALGSVTWMAPEQLTGDKETPATDLHAWACVMAFAATGSNPYGQGRQAAVVMRITQGSHNIAGRLPMGTLRTAILRCLDQDPSRRPTTAQVRAILSGSPEPEDATVREDASYAIGPATVPGNKPWSPKLGLALAAAMTIALMGVAWSLVNRGSDGAEPRATQTRADAPPRATAAPKSTPAVTSNAAAPDIAPVAPRKVSDSAASAESSLRAYFDAINNGQYSAAYSLRSANSRAKQSYSDFKSGTDSSIVSNIRVVNSTAGSSPTLVATFVSEQSRADSPGDSGETCSRWNLTYRFVNEGGRYVMEDVRPTYGTGHTPC